MMPKMQGDELILKAKKLKNCEKTKFLIITGCLWTEDDDKFDESKYNADACLKKPFQQKDIIASLKKLLTGL
jgi:DNA-binding response OmpR family regulator